MAQHWSLSLNITRTGEHLFKIFSRKKFPFMHFTYCLTFYVSLALSHKIPQQFPVHGPYNAHCLHLQQRAQISVNFKHTVCFIYFISWFTSSEPTNKIKRITYFIICYYVYMFSTDINHIPPNIPHIQFCVWYISAKTIHKHNLCSQQQHWNVAVLFVVIRIICCYALECWKLHGKSKKYKQILHCRFNFDIFKHYLLSRKNLMFWTSVSCSATPCYLVINARRVETTYWLHIQLSKIKINISLNEFVFAIILRKVDIILPGATVSHLVGRDTECICLHQEFNWHSWGTCDLEGNETKNFKKLLGKEYDYFFRVTVHP